MKSGLNDLISAVGKELTVFFWVVNYYAPVLIPKRKSFSYCVHQSFFGH